MKEFDEEGNCVECLDGGCEDCDGSIPCKCRDRDWGSADDIEASV